MNNEKLFPVLTEFNQLNQFIMLQQDNIKCLTAIPTSF